MSLVARRLSACLPQEALARRPSPTAADIAAQISQRDALCPFTPGYEDKGYWVHQDSSPQPFSGQRLHSATSRRLSLDVTRLSRQELSAATRSPVWRLDPARSKPESALQQDDAASLSSGHRFLESVRSLSENCNNTQSPVASPGVVSLSPHSTELLPSGPARQQRRQSWGPAVFSPSPGSSKVQMTHRLDVLSPCSAGLLRLSPLNTSLSSTSLKTSAHRFEFPFDAHLPTVSPTSPNVVFSQCKEIPLPTPTIKIMPSPCHARESEGSSPTADNNKRYNRSITSAQDTAMSHTANKRSLEALVTAKRSSAGKAPYIRSLVCQNEWRPKASLNLPPATRRRASWHTTLAPGSSGGPSSSHRHDHFGSSMSWRPCSLPPPLPPRLLGAPSGSVLGQGGFGIVKLGRYKGREVAVKVLKGRRAAASSDREAKVLPLPPHAHLTWTLAVVTNTAEGRAKVSWASIMERRDEMVSHETVTAMFSLSMEDTQGYHSNEQHHGNGNGEGEGEGGALWWAWVVSELCLPHTLLTLINDTSLTLSSETRVRYILEVSRGLAHLHTHGLAHRDLKPANLLLTTAGHLKIADFGCCARLDEQDEDTVLGTVRYQAPEVLRGAVGGSYSDMFSLGVTTWHLLTRALPYQGLHPHVIIYQVAFLNHRPPDHHPLPAPHTFQDQVLWRLAHSCWSKEHSLRPSATALCRHLTLLLSSPNGVHTGARHSTTPSLVTPSPPSITHTLLFS